MESPLKTSLILQTLGDGLQTQVVTRGFANHRREFANPKRLRNDTAGQTNKPTITDEVAVSGPAPLFLYFFLLLLLCSTTP